MKRLPRETDESLSKLLLQNSLQGHSPAACCTGLLTVVAMVSAYVTGMYSSFILYDELGNITENNDIRPSCVIFNVV
jgi:hypothetical protein